jgi:hypothetical protein
VIEAKREDVERIGALFDSARVTNRSQESGAAEQAPSEWVRTHTIANPLAAMPPELYAAFQLLVPTAGSPAFGDRDCCEGSSAEGDQRTGKQFGSTPALAQERAFHMLEDFFLMWASDGLFYLAGTVLGDDSMEREDCVGAVSLSVTDEGAVTFSYSAEVEEATERVRAAEAVTTVLRWELPEVPNPDEREVSSWWDMSETDGTLGATT